MVSGTIILAVGLISSEYKGWQETILYFSIT